MESPARTEREQQLREELLEAQIKKVETETRKVAGEVVDWQRAHVDAEAESEVHRVYMFHAEVTKGSVHECIDALDHWNRRDPQLPIKLVICSPGGAIFDGLALYGYIQQLKNSGTPIETHGVGWMASMGSVLLQAGTTRVMDRNSWLMFHQPSRSAFLETLNLGELQEEAKLFERLWVQLTDIYAERSTMSGEEIRAKVGRGEWWLRSDEALELGFIDGIIG